MNIIFYSQNGSSEYAQMMIDKNEDFVIREFKFDEVKNYKEVNPGVLIIDAPINKIKDVCMVTKFETSVLIVADEIPSDLTVRADSYDFITRPVNEVELTTRIEALAKTSKYRINLKKQSVTDELTGLYNRKYLHHRLEAEISRAKRYGTPLSCLLIDIDFFKTVNDMYGYDWGDVLLKKIAQMLEALIRKEDILTRYGDEEFILILPNTSEDNAYIFAERFRRDIEKMEFIPANEEERHPITISGGISSYPFLENVEENSNTIIRYAEHALYAAKKHGKNQIVEFSKMNLDY
ncbi:TPA: GGDEF domain-containing protein [Candidatus Galligastranaerophilus faecipullorum]|nr:GGDEF domain-containing protein [Candidatus Galligastranaerophilus faecipullorum]